ncbi:MAG TPA: hypothetical protein VD971_02120 [Phycisphaerales bacterium]|nr:hypothetical protein [Phycisphaerales bacterium]
MFTKAFTVKALVVAAGCCGAIARAQESQRVQFEVLNGGVWSPMVIALPGHTVDFRVVVSYTGSRTDLLALGNMRFQPAISNFDNTGSGASRDQFLPWLNGGVSGNNTPFSMLTQAEGNSNTPLAAYGRVFPFGATAMNAAGQNTLTEFRHDGGANRAPAGSWARLAGSFASNWPLPALTTPPVPTNELLGILRGVAAGQLSQASAGSAWQGGTQDIVVFRGAIRISSDIQGRLLQLGLAEGSMLRAGDVSSADDNRYIAWQQSPTDIGSHRVFETTILPATIWIPIPAPSALALGAFGALAASRRRRKHL